MEDEEISEPEETALERMKATWNEVADTTARQVGEESTRAAREGVDGAVRRALGRLRSALGVGIDRSGSG